MRPSRLVALIVTIAAVSSSSAPVAHTASLRTPGTRTEASKSVERVTASVTIGRAHPTAEQLWLESRAARCVMRAESGDTAHPAGDYRRGGAEPHGGAWQFSDLTWHDIGFAGLPYDASPATQNNAAFKLWRLYGWGQWQTAAGCGV